MREEIKIQKDGTMKVRGDRYNVILQTPVGDKNGKKWRNSCIIDNVTKFFNSDIFEVMKNVCG